MSRGQEDDAVSITIHLHKTTLCKPASLSTSDEERHTTAGGWREVAGSGRQREKQRSSFLIFS